MVKANQGTVYTLVLQPSLCIEMYLNGCRFLQPLFAVNICCLVFTDPSHQRLIIAILSSFILSPFAYSSTVYCRFGVFGFAIGTRWVILSVSHRSLTSSQGDFPGTHFRLDGSGIHMLMRTQAILIMYSTWQCEKIKICKSINVQTIFLYFYIFVI